MARYLYSELASLVQARANSLKRFKETDDRELFDKHTQTIEEMVDEYLPSGSGFDNGTKMDLYSSHPEKLVFTTSFPHMHSESGIYDGWTEHTIVVTPSLAHGFHLRVSGRNRNDIKDYIADTFADDLRTEFDPRGERIK